MKLAALIPARGGSKGIPNKNSKLFKGKPLIQWTISQALNSEYIDRVIVLTDNSKIAEISRNCGAEIPFLRPSYLATDFSPIIETIIYALDKLPEISDLILLQPTSPLRRLSDIKNIVDLRNIHQRESAVSVCEISEYPQWMFRLENNFMSNYLPQEKLSKRRQDLENLYILNGAIYLSTKKHLIDHKNFISEKTLPYVMNKEYSVDIDDQIDWEYAELIYDKIKNIK
tara:strand:- start:1206 stop:1889 length:684 start_codon:yes stop_codon:yes gene_type:complete